MNIKELLRLTPRKLNLAMLFIAIISLSSIIIYLFKDTQGNSKECRKDLKDCNSNLIKLQGDYRADIQHIYKEVINDIKNSRDLIKKEIQEINNKKNNVVKNQYYISNTLEKLESYKYTNQENK